MTGPKTDEELAQLDVTALLRAGLQEQEDGDRRALFGDGAVAAAILLDRLAVIPRSLVFLAEVVRSGGTRNAADLPEPLPLPEQTATIRPWLTVAADVAEGVAGDLAVERWLKAVATILAARQESRGGGRPS